MCDGVSLAAMASAAGTPVYVYSAAVFRERYAEIDRAFGTWPHAIHYALKANSTLSVARLLRSLGSGADANSAWEVDVAGRAGFTPSSIVCTGVGKSPAELECAVALGVKAINVESAGELKRIEAVAQTLSRVARVAVRVNPDIDAESHPHISTGLRINKFGVPADQAAGLCRSIAASPALRLVAVHLHVGSQITTLEPLRRAARAAADLSRALVAEGFALEYVDLGGGLGIAYDDRHPPAIETYVSALVDEVRSTGLPIIVEPGRVIAGPAGVLVARVVDIKPRDAGSDFAILDAGMTELLRPALYGAYPDRAGSCPRQRRADLRDRRSGVRKLRRDRARSTAARIAGRRSGRHSRRRRLRRRHGLELQSPAAAVRGARRRRFVACDPEAPDDRRSAGARNMNHKAH